MSVCLVACCVVLVVFCISVFCWDLGPVLLHIWTSPRFITGMPPKKVKATEPRSEDEVEREVADHYVDVASPASSASALSSVSSQHKLCQCFAGIRS